MCDKAAVQVLKERIKNNDNQNRKEHKELFDAIKQIGKDVVSIKLALKENTTLYDDRYPLRRDFNITRTIILTIIAIFGFILGFVK